VPTYDYQCRDCGNVTEVIHSMLEDGPAVCERCGGPLRRVLFPTGIIFKGPGFYRNDSRAAASDAGKRSESEKPAASASDASSSAAKSGAATTSETGMSGSTSSKTSSEP
jgi:putative FmdB family regulatory protein